MVPASLSIDVICFEAARQLRCSCWWRREVGEGLGLEYTWSLGSASLIKIFQSLSDLCLAFVAINMAMSICLICLSS